MMHRPKLSLTVWFWAAHLMATSNGSSHSSSRTELGITYETAWLLAQKLRRSIIDPRREPLEGVGEIDQAEIPFLADTSFFDAVKSAKILIVGAVEVINRGANHVKPSASTGTYRSRPCAGSPSAITRRATGTSSGARQIPQRRADCPTPKDSYPQCSKMVQFKS